MNSSYMTHLIATTANGIETVEPVDFPDADWLNFSDFYGSLKSLDDGEQVLCAVDPEQLEQLQEEYGIR